MAKKIKEGMTVIASQLPTLLTRIMSKGLVPFVESSPGLGKSAVGDQLAKANNLLLIDMRLAGADPTDLNGFPSLQSERASYIPFEDFPIEGDALPWKVPPVYENVSGEAKLVSKGIRYDGWLLLLDELPSAPRGVQAACYKLILDRMVGNNNLHRNVWIMACGNKKSDNAIVNPLGTALQSRVVTLSMRFDRDSWLDWAFKNNIDKRIIGYINWRPDNLYKFDPNHADNTFPCPRTWHFMHKLTHDLQGQIDAVWLPMFTGTIGLGVGREFYSFCNLYTKLPSLAILLSDPHNCHLDLSDMAVMHALTSVIQANITPDNAKDMIVLIERMPSEFQVLCIMETAKRNSAVAAYPEITAWIAKNSRKLMAQH